MDSLAVCMGTVVLFSGLVAAESSSGANFTVTDEAYLVVDVTDQKSPGDTYTGRIVIALFGASAPMTVMNFASIIKGYKRGKETLHYKNTPIHRIVKDFVIQMGDITVGDGTGGTSIFGEKFNDEEFVLSHRAAGMVSMANRGKDTNGSQFFITMVKARWMDGKHVVFGKVIKGFDVLDFLNDLETNPDTAWPKKKVKISDCGLNVLQKKYNLTEKQMDSVVDLP